MEYTLAMLDPRDIELARGRLPALARPLTLQLDPGADPDDRFAQVLAEVLEALVDLSEGKLSLERLADRRYPGKPSFRLGNIQYLAVPMGPELPPFLDLLTATAEGADPVDPDLPGAMVQVLVAPTCPNCPAVVALCTRLAAARPQLQLDVIDAMYFQDLAGSVTSVPAVIVEQTRTFVGQVDPEQLLDAVRRSGDASYLPEVMGSMIEAGRMTEAMPLARGEDGAAALATILRQGGLKERMGVMLLCEELLELDRHALDGAVPTLLPLVESEDPTLRGDTADLLGRIGSPSAAAALGRLLQDDHPDVREIAAEALEMLRQPS